jgi:hypothetical protein
MSPGRVWCLSLLLLVTKANENPLPQFGSDTYKPVFENAEFKIFSVKNREHLASFSEESNFAVLVLRGDSTTLNGGKCDFCFIGPTGTKNFLVFGTPGWVVPEAQRHSAANEPSVWITFKTDAEIVEPVINKNQPEQFKSSVREDLFAIAALADTAGSGIKPSKEEQSHASAALDDLTLKSKWFSLFKGPAGTPPPLIKVKVHTLKSGAEVKKWTVWYVIAGWEGDLDHTYKFDFVSSPTEQKIDPGRYKMWVSRGKNPKNKKGPTETVLVGDTPDLTKELQLETP